MRKLLVLAVAVAAGYALGTRSGREKLAQVGAKVRELWEDPRVTAARQDVEAYTRQQAPVIRERAEAAAKAASVAIVDGASAAADLAKDVAGKTSDLAKDVAGKTTDTAKDVAGKVSATAKDVADKVTDTASDVRDQAGKVASDLRERGEAIVDSAVATAGQARDDALDVLDDADDDEDITPKK